MLNSLTEMNNSIKKSFKLKNYCDVAWEHFMEILELSWAINIILMVDRGFPPVESWTLI